jgi:succinate dehydrogenase/fumarate reductase cytochrome b subunit (b558 family)
LLGAGFIAHVLGAAITTRRGHHARPIGYKVGRSSMHRARIAARSMRWTGIGLLGFLVYHVSIVYGLGHPAFVADDVHHNLGVLMRQPLHALLLWLAAMLVALHLAHGLVSAWITLGVVPQRRERLVQYSLAGWTLLISLGFALPLVACWIRR